MWQSLIDFPIFASMKTLCTHPKSMIRFRRWTRKAYAAFASLGKYVTIGQVCKSIAEASLNKTTTLCSTRKTSDTSNKEPDSSPMSLEEITNRDRALKELLELLTLKNIMLSCLSTANKTAPIISINIIRPKKATQEIRTIFPVLPFFLSHDYD